MDRFITRTPKEKPLLPKPSTSDQNLPDPNACEDPELAHAINEAVKEKILTKEHGWFLLWVGFKLGVPRSTHFTQY